MERIVEDLKSIPLDGLTKERVSQVIKGLTFKELSLLFIELDKFEESLRKKCASDVNEIVSSARAHDMFCGDSQMGDFYDNEGAAVYRGTNNELRHIESIKRFLKEIGQEKNEKGEVQND